MTHNKLLNNCQSGFRPNDSCINQLISITQNIYRAFDANPFLEIWGVFLDLSKAFNKAWHKGLLHKLKNKGINRNVLKFIKSFLHNRCQRVVLNGQSSSWLSIRAGIPQGSVLGPLFCLIYINDLPEGLNSEAKLFADDTSIFSIVNCVSTSASTINSDLLKTYKTGHTNGKCHSIQIELNKRKKLFSPERKTQWHIHHSFSTILKFSLVQKHLGLTLDSKLSFNEHINDKIYQASKGVGLLRKLKAILLRNSLLTIYKSFIRPLFDYANVIYDQLSNASFAKKVESVQDNGALAITATIKGSSHEKLNQELGLEYLYRGRWARRLCLLYKILSTG